MLSDEIDFDYPPAYVVKPWQEQVATLKKRFPELSTNQSEASIERVVEEYRLPDGAEGWFVIPKYQQVARNYVEAVELVLALLASNRRFRNWRRGHLAADALRSLKHSDQMMRQRIDAQAGALTVLPAQLGRRYAAYSADLTIRTLASTEFCLGAFAVGCILLTHDERFPGEAELGVTMPGDVYARAPGGPFDRVPRFFSIGNQRGFGTCRLWAARQDSGCATAFVPSSDNH